MIVGESLSCKLDPEDRRLKFKVPETEADSAESWRNLIDIDDTLGDLKDLQSGVIDTHDASEPAPEETISADDFLVDAEEDGDEDADLQKYAFPDSDAEDSDDDPTLVTREKTTPPLYPLKPLPLPLPCHTI